MSDQHDRPEQAGGPGESHPLPASPYGQPAPPQPPASPYGVPPAGEPPWGQVPYGQSPYHHNPYGQPAYGMPGFGAPLRDPDARPGTVLAAGIITLVTAGLVLLLLLVFTVVLVAVREDFVRGFREGAGLSGTGDAGGWFVGILVVMLAFSVWCVVAIVLAVLALRRNNAARIGLVVSSALTAGLSLLAITGGASVVTLAASIAVIVCLFTGGAGAWYRRSKEPDAPGLAHY